MGSGMPGRPDYMGAAQQQAGASQQALNQQTVANRPDQSNPFASTTWQQGPGGQWSQSTQFTGPLAGASTSLQQQAAEAYSRPFDMSGLPQLTDGATARDQAINAAYGQASSRLDPQWQQREEQTRTRLLNQGLAEGSEAYNDAMANLGRERNDAYSSAMSGAIGQGTAAGSALFNQSLASRNQGLTEALRSRGQALSDLQNMQGLTGQQGFMGAGMSQVPDYMGALGAQYGADMDRYQMERQNVTEGIQGGAQLAALIAQFAALSDERAKVDIHRLDVEVLPGVPLAVWRYRPEHGDSTVVWAGVIAQDLRAVRPDAVRVGEDGLLHVSSEFAPKEVWR